MVIRRTRFTPEPEELFAAISAAGIGCALVANELSGFVLCQRIVLKPAKKEREGRGTNPAR